MFLVNVPYIKTHLSCWGCRQWSVNARSTNQPTGGDLELQETPNTWWVYLILFSLVSTGCGTGLGLDDDDMRRCPRTLKLCSTRCFTPSSSWWTPGWIQSGQQVGEIFLRSCGAADWQWGGGSGGGSGGVIGLRASHHKARIGQGTVNQSTREREKKEKTCWFWQSWAERAGFPEHIKTELTGLFAGSERRSY